MWPQNRKGNLAMENIRRALYEARGKGAGKILKTQASLYEDLTLAHELVPDECIDLIVEILSAKELSSKPGMEMFLVKTCSDMERLKESQRERLLSAVLAHYGEYDRVEFCWAICDLIARSYSQDVAIDLFRRVFPSATYQGKEGVALGLDIIARSSKRDPVLMKEIEKILGADIAG